MTQTGQVGAHNTSFGSAPSYSPRTYSPGIRSMPGPVSVRARQGAVMSNEVLTNWLLRRLALCCTAALIAAAGVVLLENWYSFAGRGLTCVAIGMFCRASAGLHMGRLARPFHTGRGRTQTHSQSALPWRRTATAATRCTDMWLLLHSWLRNLILFRGQKDREQTVPPDAES